MAPLNFDESIVLILFAQFDGNRTPSRAQLVQFDADLQTSFGAKLQRILPEEQMPTDIHSRSLVLGCRPHMPGSTADTQIRQACRYILHAQRELTAPAIAALIVPVSEVVSTAGPGRKKAQARRGAARSTPPPARKRRKP